MAVAAQAETELKEHNKHLMSVLNPQLAKQTGIKEEMVQHLMACFARVDISCSKVH